MSTAKETRFILESMHRLINECLKPDKLADECAIMKRLTFSNSNSIHETLFELNASVERFIVDRLECDHRQDDEAEKSTDSCDAVIEWTWQALNCGKWSEVPVETRQVHAYHRLLKAMLIVASAAGDQKAKESELLVKALDSVDYGLIMSPDLPGRLLSKIATLIHQRIVDSLDHGNKSSSPTSKFNDVLQLSRTKHFKPISIPHLKSPVDRTIPRVSTMDLLDFEANHFRPAVPIIITGETGQWPCMADRRWSLEYLLRTAAFRTVPIEIGSKYTEESWSQKLMPLVDFIERHILASDAEVGYLAQHNLFEQIPELAKDFDVPVLCAATCAADDDDEDGEAATSVDINAWFGPPGTVSPLHTDPKHNLFTQVMGRKYVRLYSSATPTEQIYPYKENLLSNTSAVDLENVDTDRFAGFYQIDPALIHECILAEGEMLFIPKGWWHFVKSLDVSFSLSFWWL